MQGLSGLTGGSVAKTAIECLPLEPLRNHLHKQAPNHTCLSGASWQDALCRLHLHLPMPPPADWQALTMPSLTADHELCVASRSSCAERHLCVN